MRRLRSQTTEGEVREKAHYATSSSGNVPELYCSIRRMSAQAERVMMPTGVGVQGRGPRLHRQLACVDVCRRRPEAPLSQDLLAFDEIILI